MKKKNWVRWLVALLVFLAAIAAAVIYLRADRSNSEAAHASKSDLATVELGDVERTVEASGTIQPARRVDVGAQVSGQILKIHVRLGQTVKKGDLLVSIDPEIARNELAQTSAALTVEELALARIELDMAAAERELKRQRQLIAADATTAVDVEKAEQEVARLNLDLRSRRATLTRLNADSETKKTRLRYTQIVAPIDGDVISFAVQEGQTISAQQQAPTLLTLADLDRLTVKAKISESDIQLVRVGQSARFVPLARDTARYEGTVREIQPLPERVNNLATYTALFEIANPKRELMIDMSMNVTLVAARATGVPTVPLLALRKKPGGGDSFVWVQDEAGNRSERIVTIGLRDFAKAEIKSGLKVGERVALDGGMGQPPKGDKR